MRGPSFRILGFVERAGKSAVPLEQLQNWQAEGVIEYLGSTTDVRPHIAAADCVVLPSYYREGVPRILLESAAMGIPVITADSIGCREAVIANETGLLCDPRSAQSLAEAMLSIIAMDRGQRLAMGRAGRAYMERRFDEAVIHRAYLDALSGALSKGL